MSDDRPARELARVENPFTPAGDGADRQLPALVSVEQQRAIADTQARYLVARANPRDPVRAFDAILQACMRPSLAERALYSYARGGTEITGPSIRLAEAIGQRWGNIACGIKEIARRPDYSECVAYAHDLETGFYDERQFQVKHWRDTKKGGYRLTDERDIYEAIANFGQRRKRAVLLAVIPGDVVDAAVEQCERTLHAKADTSPAALRKLADAFAEIGVTREQIEARCQRRIDALHPAQIVHLRKIYVSIRDGMSEARDWFDVIELEAEPQRGNAGLRAAMAATVNQPTGRAGTPPAAESSRPAQPSEQKGEEASTAADSANGDPAEPAGDFIDHETGEVGEAAAATETAPADLSKERDPFWGNARLLVEPILGTGRSRKPDWVATHSYLLYLIRTAETDDGLTRMERESHRTLGGLKLAYVGLYDEVIEALAKRHAELREPADG